MKIYLVWEREAFDDYGVIFISSDKDVALRFIKDLTGKDYEKEKLKGNVRGFEVVDFEDRNKDSEVYLEERETEKYYKLH